MSKAVVLLSGGMDSATCLAVAKRDYDVCYALSFDYGQKHEAELQAAAAIAAAHEVKVHRVFPMAIGAFGGSALTASDLEVPDYSGHVGIPVTYVPARNTTFLAVALGWAEILDAQAIFIGACAVDRDAYPDCRPEFIAAFQALADVATKCGVEGQPITVQAPLLGLSKAQIIALGTSLGVDYTMTVTCYRANALGEACGRCNSCTLRKQGFIEAGLPDATRYVPLNRHHHRD